LTDNRGCRRDADDVKENLYRCRRDGRFSIHEGSEIGVGDGLRLGNEDGPDFVSGLW